MRARSSVALSLLVAGLLVASPFAAGAAFAVVPNNPANLTATPSPSPDDSSVVLSWEVVPDGAPFGSYGIDVIDNSGVSNVLTVRNLSSNITSYTIPTTVAGHSYFVQVLAFNPTQTQYGVATVTFTAPTPPQLSAPTNVAITRDATSNGFTVTWGAPVSDGGSDILSYSVHRTNVSDSSTESATVAPDQFSHDFSDESLGTYFVSVSATVSGNVSPSAGSSFVLAAVAPTAPRNVQLVDNGTGILEATWDAPAYDGGSAVQNYFSVVTDTGGNNYLTSSDVTGRDAIFHVSNLVAGTYTVAVEAVNSVGASNAVTSFPVTTTAATVPATPTVDDAYGNGYHDAFVHLNWTAPADGGDPISSFTVRLYDVDIHLIRTVTVDSDQDSYDFGGLEHNTGYSVTVQATNSVGDSAESASFDAVTLSTIPPLPPSDIIEFNPDSGLDHLTITGNTAHVLVVNAHAGDWVFGGAYSDGRPLGWTQVDADGYVTWTLPTSPMLAAGSHHLVVLENDGGITGSATFRIGAATTTSSDDLDSGLASTGTELNGPIAAALLALLLGAAFVTRSVVRRKRA
jgi:hypothetical protein